MSAPELSIIIPVKGNQTDLDRVLGDLEANPPEGNWELVVIDDGSDQALALGKHTKERWNIFRSESTQGAARSRNLGAGHARGVNLVFLSVFIKIPKDYISRLGRFIAKNKFDYAQHLLEKARGVSTTHFQDYLLDQKKRASGSENPGIKESLFTAAVIKADVFKSLGGFDPSMHHYGGHELDLIYRMEKAGYQNRKFIRDIPLERISVSDHKTVRNRLIEYASVGLPNLLKIHPELKQLIFRGPTLWTLFSSFGIPRIIEKRIQRMVDENIKLTRGIYRLYLHLVVRNAWTAR